MDTLLERCSAILTVSMRRKFLLGLADPVQPGWSPQGRARGLQQQPQSPGLGRGVGAPAPPFALGLPLKRVGNFLLPLATWEKIAAAFCEQLNPISVQGAWPRNVLWM